MASLHGMVEHGEVSSLLPAQGFPPHLGAGSSHCRERLREKSRQSIAHWLHCDQGLQTPSIAAVASGLQFNEPSSHLQTVQFSRMTPWSSMTSPVAVMRQTQEPWHGSSTFWVVSWQPSLVLLRERERVPFLQSELQVVHGVHDDQTQPAQRTEG